MTEKEEKQKGKWATKRENAGLILVYCALFMGMGAVILLNGVSEDAMYNALKDDEYLTDDGLPYRDMGNATYTYPVSEIDKLASASDWPIGMGVVIIAVSIIMLFVVMWLMPEKKDIHLMLCDGSGDKEYCPECGLKLSKLDEKGK